MDQEANVSIPEKANLVSLPDDILLHIFEYLPFKDRVRLSRVSKKLQEISEKSIAESKSLDLNEDLIAYIANYHFMSLLDSWTQSVERIKATSKFSKWLLKSITERLFPKLTAMELAVPFSDSDDVSHIQGCYADLVRRNPNIKSLILRFGHEIDFARDVVYENLERLEIGGGDTDYNVQDFIDDENPNFTVTLESLTDRTPNLKTLILNQKIESDVSFNISFESIVEFMNSTQKLENVRLILDYDTVEELESFPGLTKLLSLKSLKLAFIDDDDCEIDFKAFLLCFLRDNIAIACPNLERLALGYNVNSVDHEVAKALTKFENLIHLDYSVGKITRESFLELIDSCPKLKELKLATIVGGASGYIGNESYIDMLKSVAGIIGDRELIISIGDLANRAKAIKEAWEEAKGDSKLEIDCPMEDVENGDEEESNDA